MSLFYAIHQNDTNQVIELLQQGHDPNHQNHSGDIPLHKACKVDNVICLKALLQAGSQIEVQNEEGKTPFHIACSYDSTECVNELLKIVNINLKTVAGETALHLICCTDGKINTLRALLSAGASPNIQDNYQRTPLHIACYNGQDTYARELVASGCDYRLRNRNGETALHIACYRGSIKCVNILLKYQNDVNVLRNDGQTPLHLACEHDGNGECIQALLNAGALINSQSVSKWTPLHVACLNGYYMYVEDLLKAGADPNLQNNFGETPLYLTPGSLRCVNLLLKYQARLDHVNNKGQTVLHVSVAHHFFDCVKLLLRTPININAQDNKGQTVLHYVCSADQRLYLVELLNFGIDISIRDNQGKTALQIAEEKKYQEMVDLIKEYDIPLIKEPE